jgi:hypothetical protein
MIDLMQDNWIAALPTMTCRNIVNKIVLKFKPDGNTLQGEIKAMPLSLLSSLARKKYSA